jgi:hypothetical protein
MNHVKSFTTFITEKKKPGLWDNVQAKRRRGESPAKPGSKGYPKEKAWKAASTKESQGYTQFMQQAQVAQSGNPYWFGANPKKSKKSNN